MDAKQTILDEIVDHARKLICNQAMYQMSTPELRERWDDWYDHVDSLDPELIDEIYFMISQHPLCEYNAVLQLVANASVLSFYDEDSWLDDVADYIDNRTNETEDLVRAIAARTGWV